MDTGDVRAHKGLPCDLLPFDAAKIRLLERTAVKGELGDMAARNLYRAQRFGHDIAVRHLEEPFERSVIASRSGAERTAEIGQRQRAEAGGRTERRGP